MERVTRVAEILRARRKFLGLTQRSLARQLGIAASHVTFIESGRRKPSLKLVARIADALGLDRQDVLLLTHPEARVFVPETESQRQTESQPHVSGSWRRFIQNSALLARYRVTKPELDALEPLSLLGTDISTKDFLAILILIRDIPRSK
jgi:transcriptional regulator with XRE-family HTH domain